MWTLQVTFKKKICHEPCKKYAGQEKCVVFLKTGSGSGSCRIRIRPKMDRIRNPGVTTKRTSCAPGDPARPWERRHDSWSWAAGGGGGGGSGGNGPPPPPASGRGQGVQAGQCTHLHTHAPLRPPSSQLREEEKDSSWACKLFYGHVFSLC